MNCLCEILHRLLEVLTHSFLCRSRSWITPTRHIGRSYPAAYCTQPYSQYDAFAVGDATRTAWLRFPVCDAVESPQTRDATRCSAMRRNAMRRRRWMMSVFLSISDICWLLYRRISPRHDTRLVCDQYRAMDLVMELVSILLYLLTHTFPCFFGPSLIHLGPFRGLATDVSFPGGSDSRACRRTHFVAFRD